MRSLKRALCLLLVLVMFAGFIPATEAYAVSDTEGFYIPVSTYYFGHKCGNPKHASSDMCRGGFDIGDAYIALNSDYGPRNVDVGSKYHHGIDIGNWYSTASAHPQKIGGQPIYAVHSGKASFSSDPKNKAPGGNTVTLKFSIGSDKYVVTYMHLKSSTLTAGAEPVPVEQGAILGFVGNSGSATTGTHLHFEIKKNGSYINPKPGVNIVYKTTLHQHTYNNLGVCTDPTCGKEYDYESSRAEKKGTIIASTSYSCVPVQIRQKPYSDSPLVATAYSCKTVATVVVTLDPNKPSKNWYEVTYSHEGATCKGYVENTGNIVFTPGEGSVSIKVPEQYQIPAQLTVGKSARTVGGTVTSMNKLNYVKAGIYRADNGSVKYEVIADSISGTSYNLHAFDDDLLFSKLPAGNYIYRIVADANSDGTPEGTATWNSNHKEVEFSFSVVPKAVPNYTVVFYGKGGLPETQTRVAKQGAAIALSELTTPVQNGYIFQGWSAEPGDTVADYSPNGSYSPMSSTALYAVWKAVPPPATPSLNVARETNVGLGRKATVSWWAQSEATGYTATFYRADGTEYFSVDTAATEATALMKVTGTFTVRVKARNTGGESAYSQPAAIIVHDDVTVIFKDYNGTVWSRQTVTYGDNAVEPGRPSRQGYTFSGWTGASLYNVTEDRELTAGYTAIGYTVTFLDCKGKVADVQTVYYNEDTPGSATPPDASLLDIPEGYVLEGWSTEEYLSVTRDGIVVSPCAIWGNPDIPVTTTIDSVEKSGEGYWVDYTITNHIATARKGRVVVALKTGFGKFVTKTESGAFYLAGNGSYSGNLYVPVEGELGDEAFSTVEVYVVENYSSMVPISQTATRPVLESGDDSDWSVWMTESEYAAYTGDKSETQTRTEYQSRTKTVTDWMRSGYYLGWAQNDTRTVKSDWSSFGDWQDAPITANDNTDVETRQTLVSPAHTEYRYGRYWSTTCDLSSSGKWSLYSDVCSAASHSSSWSLNYTAWGTTRYSPVTWYRASKNNSAGTGVYNSSDKMYHWNQYTIGSTSTSNNKYKYWWEESREVAATYKTQYRARTRTDVAVYQFWKWSDWSDWSTTPATASSTVQIETRTLYRVKLPTPTGEGATISGTVGISNPGGRQAVLAIYSYTGASDYTNQYLAQTTLGADGSYSFENIVPFETPSVDTGDFTATITIEGSTGPLFLDTGDLFLAPKPSYEVVFVDEVTGQQLGETQTVELGGAATAPAAPDKPGYTFIGWEYGLTNIRDNMTIKARYTENLYTVVFVDWANSTIAVKTDVPYGTVINQPDPEPREGYKFVGWQTEEGDDADFVTGSMLITAKFEKLTYPVRFLSPDGDVLSEQTVAYQEAAAEPDTSGITLELGQYFDCWSSNDFLCVTQPIDVIAVLMFEEDSAIPDVTLDSGVYEGTQTVTVTCEDADAVITYTIDNGDETADSEEQLYSGPITVAQSSVIEFNAAAPGKNSVSDTYEYTIVPEGTRPAAPAAMSDEQDTGKITLSWPAVPGATGYIIYKSDLFGQEERFMTTETRYEDSNVLSLTDYTYSVSAYTMYGSGEIQSMLESEGRSAETAVYFFGENLPVTSIEVSASDVQLIEGDIIQLYAAILPTTAYEQSVTWSVVPGTGFASVTDEGVLTVDEAGSFTVVAAATDGSGVTGELELIATAPDESMTALTVSSDIISTGETANVSVTLEAGSNASVLQFALLYDSSALTVTSATAGALMTGVDAPTINSATPGVVTFVWDDTTGLTLGGSVLDLSFTSTATPGATMVLQIPQYDADHEFVCQTGDFEGVDCMVTNGKISILGSAIGDVNGDGSINAIDANYVRRYTANLISLNDTQLVVANVDGEGTVNIVDANLIRRYAAGIISSFPATPVTPGS